MIISDKFMQNNSQLMQIIGALNSQRLSFGLGNYREQKRGENSNDGDDDQKLNQSERRIYVQSSLGHNEAIPDFHSFAITLFSPFAPVKTAAPNQLDFDEPFSPSYVMALPNQPVTLSVEQLVELNRKLATMRHDVNNHLSLMMAAVELIRYKPETAERMLTTLGEQPAKVAQSISQFSAEFEKTLGITRP